MVADMEVPMPQLTKEELYQFARDVEEGLSDEELKEKYRMSDRTLVIHKVAISGRRHRSTPAVPGRRRKVSAVELVNDIRSGMDEDAMKEKYGLTSRELQRLFRRIISAGLMTAQELADRLKITESQLTEVFAMAAGLADQLKQEEEK